MSVRTSAAAALLLSACSITPDSWSERLADWERAMPAPATEPALPLDAPLSELLALAERNNSGLRAAWHGWRAALARVPSSGALPDPRLTLGASLDAIETRNGPILGRIGLAQPLPWPGKRGARAERAFALAEMERERFESVRLVLRRDLMIAWYELVWLEQALSVVQSHRDLVMDDIAVVRARYEVAQTTHADLIRSEIELTRVNDRVADLLDRRASIVARINLALERPSHAPFGWPEESFASLFGAGGPLAAGIALDEVSLRADLAATSPRLRQLTQAVVATGHGARLAELGLYPNFSVGAESTRSGTDGGASGEDALAFTFGVELPLQQGARRAARDAARSAESAARAALTNGIRRAEVDLADALYAYRDAERRIDCCDELLPRAEDVLASLRASYQTGAADFTDLLDSEQAVLQYELDALRANADRVQAVARLEQITGTTLAANN